MQEQCQLLMLISYLFIGGYTSNWQRTFFPEMYSFCHSQLDSDCQSFLIQIKPNKYAKSTKEYQYLGAKVATNTEMNDVCLHPYA